MPGALVTTDELPQSAVAAHIEMSRYLYTADLLKIGVFIPVQAICEERLHVFTAKLAGWQADDQFLADKESHQEWAVHGGYVVGQWSKDFATGRVMVDMFESSSDGN